MFTFECGSCLTAFATASTLTAALLAGCSPMTPHAPAQPPGHYQLGRAPTAAELRGWDIAGAAAFGLRAGSLLFGWAFPKLPGQPHQETLLQPAGLVTRLSVRLMRPPSGSSVEEPARMRSMP